MSDTDRPRVLIADDHAVLAHGLALALEMEGIDATVVQDPHDVVAVAGEVRPDAVLLDLDLGGGVTSVPYIGPLAASGCSVVVVSGVTDSAQLAETLEAGAVATVGKSSGPEEIIAAVHDIVAGRPAMSEATRLDLLGHLRQTRRRTDEALAPFRLLTPKETVVLADLMQGHAADTIAERHFVSLATVRSQIRAVLQKLGVNTQLAAVALANDVGWQLPESCTTPG